MRSKNKAKVNRVTISRLYNAGNYEHIRYELTADVPEGVSAKKVTQGILSILKACNPKCPVNTYAMTESQKRINMTSDQQKVYWGENWQERLEQEKKELAGQQQEMDEWNNCRRMALEKFDDLTSDIKDELPW